MSSRTRYRRPDNIPGGAIRCRTDTRYLNLTVWWSTVGDGAYLKWGSRRRGLEVWNDWITSQFDRWDPPRPRIQMSAHAGYEIEHGIIPCPPLARQKRGLFISPTPNHFVNKSWLRFEAWPLAFDHGMRPKLLISDSSLINSMLFLFASGMKRFNQE